MKYVLPTKPINPMASAVNNITMEDGQMFHYGRRVNAVSYHQAFNDFDQFISNIGPAVVLAAHCGHRFDFTR